MSTDICDGFYYEVYIKKNNKKKDNRNKYIGFLNKKVVFFSKDFYLPSYLTEGKYDIEGKYLEDRNNYIICHKVELPTMYEVLGIPKKAFINNNTTDTLINNIPVKVAKNYIEINHNNNKCRISLFQRVGNYRNVDMVLLNVNGVLNVLNDTNPFTKKGILTTQDFNEVIRILSNNYSSDTLLYLISEFMWISEELYSELYEKVRKGNSAESVESEDNNGNIIENLCSICAYGNWSIGTYNLNIPVANKELGKLI